MINSIKRCIVLIPIYEVDLSESELFSINNTISVLKNWNICIIAPKHLSDKFSSLFKHAVYFEYFDDFHFESVFRYNKLMLSLDFYKKFIDYEFILIVQLDALVLYDNLDYWCNRNYSYIGAPWFNDSYYSNSFNELIGVGNGGFSLRKTHDCISVLSKFRYLPNKTYWRSSSLLFNFFKFIKHCVIFSYSKGIFLSRANEDLFWGVIVPQFCEFFNVPSPEDAIDFAFEDKPELLYRMNGEKLPFGCHAWEKYNRDFWVNILNLKI